MAFILGFSLHEFKVLPFGLYNAPSKFKCLINYIFSGIIDWYVLVHLDNMLVHRKSARNYKKHLH